MDSLADIVEAADTPLGLVALVLLGIFVLLWKYGGEMLRLSRETHADTAETKKATKDVQKSIVTNHGSKNIGDAIDRLTEGQERHSEMQMRNAQHLSELSALMQDHLLDTAKHVKQIGKNTAAVEQLKQDFHEHIGGE